MTPRQATAVARLPIHWRRFVRAYYHLPVRVNLSHSLSRAGISFEQLVMMLAAKRDTRVPLTCLTGRPIIVGPSFVLKYRVNGHPPTKCPDRCWRDRKIVFVAPEFSRMYGGLMRSNCTPRSLHARGVPWRSLQRYLDSGNMRVSQ